MDGWLTYSTIYSRPFGGGFVWSTRGDDDEMKQGEGAGPQGVFLRDSSLNRTVPMFAFFIILSIEEKKIACFFV